MSRDISDTATTAGGWDTIGSLFCQSYCYFQKGGRDLVLQVLLYKHPDLVLIARKSSEARADEQTDFSLLETYSFFSSTTTANCGSTTGSYVTKRASSRFLEKTK